MKISLRVLGASLFVILLRALIVDAPTMPYYYIRVRITAYSQKQPYESSKTSLGKTSKNEIGAAVPKGFLPYGTKIVLPNGQRRIVDDRVPQKSVRTHKTKCVVDARYFESVKSKSKTRAVNKELRKKFDMGWGTIKVFTE